ncbi:regulator of chromosome condensation 1/beta-lactamase-inhibitor protein II [Daldinia grandis]|nr:regulator of chromosome condensation 1/beta-lactamase-inhibitor protein II [Daldinia grandis]
MPPRRLASAPSGTKPLSKKSSAIRGAPTRNKNGRVAAKQNIHNKSDGEKDADEEREQGQDLEQEQKEDKEQDQDENEEQEKNVDNHDKEKKKTKKQTETIRHEPKRVNGRVTRITKPPAAPAAPAAPAQRRTASTVKRGSGKTKAAAKANVKQLNLDREVTRRRDQSAAKSSESRGSKRKREEVEDEDEELEDQEPDYDEEPDDDEEPEDQEPDDDEEPEEAPKLKKPRGGRGAQRKKIKVQAEEPKPVPTSAKPHDTLKSAPKKSTPRPRTRGPGARGVPFNEVPTKQLDVFVFGEGSSGELGLGSKKHDGKKPIDVRRPRINHNLKGVVAIACGGMHCIALTHDQTILTWGVNDDKALGRDTFWEGGTRDVDDEDDSEEDDDDTGVNPKESTPGKVDLSVLPEGTRIAQVAASDSASFILTDDGWVYGWGTFRGSDGIIGFSERARIQETPAIVPELKNITKLACGSNHVLALDLSGKVFTWGSGGQFQLGRKPISRLAGPGVGLTPQPCGRFTKKHRAINVGAGSYHSFYIDSDDQVWAWGLNNYAQTGLREHTGEDDAMVLQPQVVTSLEDHKVTQVVGGEHHSVACTTEGKLLTWGRVDGHQVGQPSSLYNEENTVFDDNKKPRILLEPTPVNGIKATFVATGTDTSFALDEAGKVYSWGFSANYQAGQGTTDDIELPTVIDNTAIRGRRIVWAGAGGQYSAIAAEAEDNVPNSH